MSFKEIKGNRQTIEFLKNVFLSKRIPGTFLFYGKEGIGKRLVAKNLAKAINCLKNDNMKPCDECVSCRKIETANHPDIFWIYPEAGKEVIKIEQIRDLKEKIYLKKSEARKKVFIIDNAESLSIEAANACLKILEEPPQDSLIILVSTDLKRMLPTIISRCYKIKFVPLAKKELKFILKEEYGKEETLAHYLAYFCEGRIGRALNLSKKEDLLNWKNEIIDNFFSFNFTYENKQISREKTREILEIILSFFRDIFIIKSTSSQEEIINIDCQQWLLRDARLYSFFQLTQITDFVIESFFWLERNINPKLILDNLKIMAVR